MGDSDNVCFVLCTYWTQFVYHYVPNIYRSCDTNYQLHSFKNLFYFKFISCTFYQMSSVLVTFRIKWIIWKYIRAYNVRVLVPYSEKNMFTKSKHRFSHHVQNIFIRKSVFLNKRVGKQKTTLWFNELFRTPKVLCIVLRVEYFI